MRRSDNFIEVLKAIDEAKQSIRSLKKGAKNPHFKNDYADLDEVLDVLKRPLHSNSISLNQFPDEVNGKFVLTTVLTHLKTGAFVETDFPLILEKNTAQGQGSAITYARRYSLTAIFGLHEFDDDGNAASNDKNEDDPRTPKDDPKMPKPTLLSLLTKYTDYYKVDRQTYKPFLHHLRYNAEKIGDLGKAEEFIKTSFEKMLNDKRSEEKVT